MTSGDPSLEWDCKECQANEYDRTRNCAWLEIEEEDLNENISWAFAPGLRNCPKSIVDEIDRTYLDWWREHKQLGLLPWPGTLRDQPAHVAEAFSIAELVVAEHQERIRRQQEGELEKAMEKAKRGGR